MALKIIKPPRRGKMFVSLAASGYLFFSTDAVAELNITENKGVLLAQDERGQFYTKTTDYDDPEAFRLYIRKNGLVSVRCIQINALLRRHEIKVQKTTRYALIEAEDGFYRIDGLNPKKK